MALTNAITTKPRNFKNTLSVSGLDDKSGEEVLASVWGLSDTKVKEISNINKMYHSKHGLFASVPIICRNQDCHYKDVCMADPSQRVIGERCIVEISAIITRFNQWCEHFGIDTSQDFIESKDLVDATLIKDLVVVEVQILRAENKIALSGDFMGDTLIEIDKKCQPYYGTTVTPEVEFLMSLQDKKMKILNQLNATRKDKASTKQKETASDEAVKIFQQMQNIQKANKQNIDIMDVDFDENGEIIVEEPQEEIVINQDETEENEE